MGKRTDVLESRRGFLKKVVGASSLLPLVTCSEAPFIQTGPDRGRNPNIIILYPDQQKQDVLGAYGHPICQTAQIDSLAEEGVCFNSFTTPAAVCSPSRACLLTGMYPHRHGVVVNNITLGAEQVTLSDLLRQQGYECLFVGKWHLTDVGLPGFVPPQDRHHFNRWIGFNRGHGKEYRTFYQDDPTLVQTGKYTTDGVVDDALQLMEEHRDQPFFAWIAIPDPHSPWSVRSPYDRMYDPRQIQLPDNYIERAEDLPPGPARSRFQEIAGRIEDWIETHASTNRKEAFQEITAQYLGMVSCVDENIGRILDWLRRRGLEEDTIVIFTTDHGEFMGSHGLLTKGIHYDEAYRLPFILRYPRLVSPETRSDELASIIDLFPTLMELTGIPCPERVQGTSLVPHLRGEASGLRDEVYWELYDQRTIRTREWKYIYNHGAPDEMYDLVNDPLELNNLIEDPQYEEQRGFYYERLKAWVNPTKTDVLMA